MTTTFHELTPYEQRKVLTLKQQIYQMSQLCMGLMQDIDALQSKQFYTVADTKNIHLFKTSNAGKAAGKRLKKATSNTVLMRYVEQMRSGKFTAVGELAVRKRVVDKYTRRIATLQNECLALYAKVDAEIQMRMGHACYDTPEMHARFQEMSLGLPTSAELQGRLALEAINYTAWDGVPRCALKDFGRVPQE